MLKKYIYIYSFCFFLIALFVTKNSLAAERVFYEDCEDVTYSEWFLERSMGTSSYWDELTSELTRSTETCYDGNYCMTYDPWTTGNPHGNIGYAVTNGNTDNFLLNEMTGSTYYFTWYQRWEPGIDYSGSAENKLLYLGYGEWGGDFTFTLKKNGDDNFHITVRSNPGYTITHNVYPTFSGGSIDDMEWHKMEVYIDVGTTGPTGYFFVKCDGIVVYEQLNAHFRDQIKINNNAALGITQWPSNTSGITTGTYRTWLDNLEIWDGLPDPTTTLPPVTTPPVATISPPGNLRILAN